MSQTRNTVDKDYVRRSIVQEMDGSAKMFKIKLKWKQLQSWGFQVPCLVLQTYTPEVDLEKSKLKWAKRLCMKKLV